MTPTITFAIGVLAITIIGVTLAWISDLITNNK